MAFQRESSSKRFFIVFGLVFFLYQIVAARLVAAHPSGPAVFDVTKFDAKGNGKPEYTEDYENANSLVSSTISFLVASLNHTLYVLCSILIVLFPNKFSIPLSNIMT